MTGTIRASAFMGTSLDGFIARADGTFDFLPESPEPHGYDEFYASVDVLLMGRKTYETALSFGGWPFAKKPVFVLSSRALPPAPAGAVVERLSGTPQEIMTALGARGFKHVYVDGAQVVQSFLRAGMIDKITITRVPVLIGSGISIFGAVDDDIQLKHVVTRHYPSGLVQSEYEVLPSQR